LTQSPTVRYLLEPAQSRFTVQAFATGWLSSLGHSPTFSIREFAGELRFNPEAAADSALSLTVRSNSLSLVDSVSAKDREQIEAQMRTEVLETASYPDIVFQSTEMAFDKVADNWYRLRLQGELRLHGVQKPLSLDVQLKMAEAEARLSGQCGLLLSAYRIKQVSALAGMIKLKDELKFAFDIAGRKQDA
jgi:polyisoprenoid-binding protein YceI